LLKASVCEESAAEKSKRRIRSTKLYMLHKMEMCLEGAMKEMKANMDDIPLKYMWDKFKTHFQCKLSIINYNTKSLGMSNWSIQLKIMH